MASLLAGLVYVKEPQLLPIVLRHEQTREVLRRIPTTDALGWRDRAMLELLYSTGIRAGELLGLDVADVDFTGETARVFGKGQKERIVPIGKTALRLLESYLRGVRPFLLRDPREPALFINEHGKRLSYAALVAPGASARRTGGPGRDGDTAHVPAQLRHRNDPGRGQPVSRQRPARPRDARHAAALCEAQRGGHPRDAPALPSARARRETKAES